MRHVLQVVGDPVGGIRRHVHALLIGLSKEGLKQSYAYSALSQDLVFKAQLPTVDRTLDGRLLALPIYKRPAFSDIFNLLRLIKYVRSEKVEIVHGHGAKGGAYARLISAICGIKSIYTPHGGAVHDMFGPLEGRIYSFAEKIFAPFTDRFVFESEYSRDAYFCKIGRPPYQCVVNHNGIDLPDLMKIQEDSVRLGYRPIGNNGHFNIGVFGVLRSVKGQRNAIAAAKLLIDRGFPVRLYLFGEGPDSEKLREMAVSIGVIGAVNFCGQVDNPEAHMFGMDLILIPSLFESFGYVALEAFSVKRPVIASATGGLKEIVSDGKDGFLVSPGNPVAICDAVARLIKAPGLAAVMGESGFRKVGEAFSLDRMLETILAVYHEV